MLQSSCRAPGAKRIQAPLALLLLFLAGPAWAAGGEMPSLVNDIGVSLLVAGALGLVVERTVLRFLYDRPLDSLLATFGISVIIRQAVQLRYSASPRTVNDPIGGSFTLAGFCLDFLV